MPLDPTVAVQPRYDLLTELWIPCLDLDGAPRDLGLLGVLRRAHELREVRDPSPPVTFGINRLLLAIVQDRLAPETITAWKGLYRAGRFDPMLIDRIREEDGDRFDVFHPTHPFYQSGDISLRPSEADLRNGNVGTVAYLRDEVPSATNVNHFRHVYDDRQAFCPACIARGLVTLPPFASSGGRPYTPSLNGDPPIYAWLSGSNLFDTLCWNLVLPPYRPKAAVAASDRPAWRGDGAIRSKEVRSEVGFVESLTWQPRRYRLLPEAGGPCTFCGHRSPILVRQLVRDQGRSRARDAPWWRDPFVAYVGGEEGRPQAVRPREDRPLWRDYAVLFLPTRQAGARHPARIVEQAADLAEALGPEAPRPSLQGFALRNESGKAKFFEWRCESLPFSPRLVADPERSNLVERSLTKAEDVAGLLKSGLKRLYPRDGAGNARAFDGLIRQARDGYWAALAEPFRRLVLDLAEPGTDPDAIDDAWPRTLRAAAATAFELVADSFDVDAEALRRAAGARRLFYGLLKKKLG